MEMSDFDRALPYILKFEGGYVNDPADPGGATNMGITQREYTSWLTRHNLPNKDVKNITMDEVKSIYEEDYWIAGSCDKLVLWPCNLAHFDACVNCGTKQAAKFLQKALRLPDDGIIGPKTLITFNTAPADLTFTRMLFWRAHFYCDLAHSKPTLQKFLYGWLKRVFEIWDVAP